jgi:hypothetical protein
MSQPLAASSPQRLGVLVLALAGALLLLFVQLKGSPRGLTALPLYDFVEYWAAGRLNAHGDNPYDPVQVEQLERSVGRDSGGILMWNPPWTLALVMPLGLLDCRVAHLLWLGLHLIVLVWCSDALWRVYGGPPERRMQARMLIFAFVPTLVCLTVGQIGPLLLLGSAAFLVAIKHGREGWAGAATVLLAVKPHLAYLFWIVLLLWIVRQRRWAVLGGGVLVGGLAVGVALLCNPHVLSQYWDTFTHQPPAQYRSPTLGMALRLLLGEEHFRLQFLAMLPGLAWLALYWRCHRQDWGWSERLPMLLLVSMLTAPYGAWLFDLVLLLVPVLQRAAAVRRDGWPLPLGVFAAFNGLVIVQLAFDVEYFYFLWMTPALLLAYLALRPRRAPVLA